MNRLTSKRLEHGKIPVAGGIALVRTDDLFQARWMVDSYVVSFFAASSEMIGIAVHAGLGLSTMAVVHFDIITILAFVQRAVTGQ